VGWRSVESECNLGGWREGRREGGRQGGGGVMRVFVYRRRDIGEKLALEWGRRLAP
jgi:hypothetical protein